MAYVSCITKEEYESILSAAGLTSMSSIYFFDFFSLFNNKKTSSSRITRKIWAYSSKTERMHPWMQLRPCARRRASEYIKAWLWRERMGGSVPDFLCIFLCLYLTLPCRFVLNICRQREGDYVWRWRRKGFILSSGCSPSLVGCLSACEEPFFSWTDCGRG